MWLGTYTHLFVAWNPGWWLHGFKAQQMHHVACLKTWHLVAQNYFAQWHYPTLNRGLSVCGARHVIIDCHMRVLSWLHVVWSLEQLMELIKRVMVEAFVWSLLPLNCRVVQTGSTASSYFWKAPNVHARVAAGPHCSVVPRVSCLSLSAHR